MDESRKEETEKEETEKEDESGEEEEEEDEEDSSLEIPDSSVVMKDKLGNLVGRQFRETYGSRFEDK